MSDSPASVHLTRLELEQFRAYRALELAVPPDGMRIVGPNGTGKSTLLEAVELLSTTRPRRGGLDADMIGWESGVDLGVAPYARVVGDVDRGGVNAHIEVFIQRSQRGNASKKLLRVADRPRRAADVVGLLPTVSFAPDDLDLVLGSPSVRRRYLDVLLSQTDRRYLRSLSRYAKILSQRNGLLKRVAGEDVARPTADEFAYWDEHLVALGSAIIASRLFAVDHIADAARRWFNDLAPAAGTLEVAYAAAIPEASGTMESARRLDDRTAAAQRVGITFEHSLRRVFGQDLARGATTVGPHRDDIILTIDGKPVHRFGSRGQQRIVVIALKMAEVEVVAGQLSLRPVLLLDDVLSELDESHRRALVDAVTASAGQILMTSADPGSLSLPQLERFPIYHLSERGGLARA